MHSVTQRSGLWCLGVLLITSTLGASGCTYLGKGQAELDLGIYERGSASWYGELFHGRLTANGEIYDMHALTAAHRSLPLGTVVHVVNIRNGREVVVRVNDRGPYKRGRIIDLSYGAARRLDMAERGVAPIQLQVMSFPEPVRPGLHAVQSFGHSHHFPGRISSLLTQRPLRRPADFRRFPRLRRVADILLAEHHVCRTVTGLVIA
jgi:hypothetical protein